MAVAVAMPYTATGVSELMVVLLPSSPAVLSPQHCTVPPVSSAHEYLSPADTAVAEVMPVTVTGTLDRVVLALPSWPESLPPQHCAPPPVSTAQVWPTPALMAVAVVVRPVTVTGVVWKSVVLLPSSPE